MGQAPFNNVPGQALPPVDPTNLGIPPTIPSPSPLPTTSVSDSAGAIETWVERIEQIITNEPNPRKRADAINRLKDEYQQNVLGLKIGSAEDKQS